MVALDLDPDPHRLRLVLSEDELGGVLLRPHTVYGVGRDQGLTSAPTRAMLAAARDEAFEIPFGGAYSLRYAPDVARAFVQASRSNATDAAVHNLAGTVTSSDVVAETIERFRRM